MFLRTDDLRWFKPQAFNDFQPTTEMVNQPCARTWWKLSKALHAMKALSLNDRTLRLATVSGAVAQYGTEFLAFEKYYEKLPDIKAILAGKEKFTHDASDPSLTYAFCGSLVEHANEKNISKVIEAARALPETYQVNLVSDLRNAVPEIVTNAAYADWCLEHVDLFE